MTRREIDARLEAEYQRAREDARRGRDERESQARRLDPEIGRLRGALYGRFQAAARSVLAGADAARAGSAALRAEVEKNRREVERRLKALGFAPDHLEMRFSCGACRDTGWLDEFKSKPCTCRLRREAELMMEGAGLRREWRGFDEFDEGIYPDAAQKKQALAARALCEAYADAFPGGEKPNLLLMGESGLGKTFLMEAIAERVSNRRHPVLAVSAFGMLEAMRAYHFGQPGEGGSFRALVECGLLLIDDLGTEPMLNNITIEYLFTLLGERCAQRRHTVIATNLLPGDLMQRYGERVMSRLLDTRLCSAIRLTGADLRLSGGGR
jgi:DNA replication protein DnaC